ncbi:MAG: hypothetical protein NVS1B6_09340 [Steroidobacteraceae bacterium]
MFAEWSMRLWFSNAPSGPAYHIFTALGISVSSIPAVHSAGQGLTHPQLADTV